jgi:hypothetical protein
MGGSVTKWLRRIRGALGMGLTWAVAWAPIGVLIGMIVDPTGAMDEPWVAVGAYPGFIGGVVFSVVLGIAAGRRRFDELSLPRFAAWGAVAGLLLGVLPFTILGVGAAGAGLPLWLLGVVTMGSTALLAAASASATLALARISEDRVLLDAGADVAEVGLSEVEARELLGDGGQATQR